MKKYIIIGLVMFSMFASISILYNMYQKEKKERIRQETNVETLNSKVKQSKVRDSLNVASINALSYTVDELKQYRSADAQLIKDLKIKNKNLESYTKMSIITHDTITKTEWKVIKDNPDCMEYRDKWFYGMACWKDSTFIHENRDSIGVAVDPVYKHKFLWFQWGKKGYNVKVVNFNPKSKIDYLEYIRIKK